MTEAVEMKAATLGMNLHYEESAPTLAEIHDVSGFALLEFGTSWCEHCQRGEAAVSGVLPDYKDMLHIKVLDGKGKRLGREYRVTLWPTLILLLDGQEIDRLVRFTSEDEVRSLLRKVDIQ